MDNTIPPLRPGIVGVQTGPRPTATPVRVHFSEVLAGGARALVGGAQAALRELPGSPIVAVAVRGGVSGVPAMGALASSSPGASPHAVAEAGAPEGPGTVSAELSTAGGAASAADGSLEGTLAQQQELNLYYLQIQEEVNAQNRTFSALSNVLEVEHSTAKTAIGNIR
jgi:hypothetical protein